MIMSCGLHLSRITHDHLGGGRQHLTITTHAGMQLLHWQICFRPQQAAVGNRVYSSCKLRALPRLISHQASLTWGL